MAVSARHVEVHCSCPRVHSIESPSAGQAVKGVRRRYGVRVVVPAVMLSRAEASKAASAAGSLCRCSLYAAR